MIAFNCPKCKIELRRQDHESGNKVPCPSCGQRLQVPQGPEQESQTIMGELLFPAAAAATQAPILPATIRCVCPHCQAVIKAPPKAAGNRAPCPRCRLPVEIPVPRAELLEESPATPEPAEVLSIPQPTQKRWFVYGSGTDEATKPFGPFPIEQLQEFVTERRLLRDDFLCEEGGEVWISAYSLSELIFKSGPANTTMRQRLPVKKRVTKKSPAETEPSADAGLATSVARIFIGTILGCFGLTVLLIGLMLYADSSRPSNSSSSPGTTSPPPATSEPQPVPQPAPAVGWEREPVFVPQPVRPQPAWNDRQPPQPVVCRECKGGGLSTFFCGGCRGTGFDNSGRNPCISCKGKRFSNCSSCGGSGKRSR